MRTTVVKLLSRVLCPTDYAAQNEESADAQYGVFRSSTQKNKMQLHDFSYGISSDPLTQFAVVFGALIHDVSSLRTDESCLFFACNWTDRCTPLQLSLQVDHVGVSNAQLVAEGSRLARIYKSQSVAEQNSGKWNKNIFLRLTSFALCHLIITPFSGLHSRSQRRLGLADGSGI